MGKNFLEDTNKAHKKSSNNDEKEKNNLIERKDNKEKKRMNVSEIERGKTRGHRKIKLKIQGLMIALLVTNLHCFSLNSNRSEIFFIAKQSKSYRKELHICEEVEKREREIAIAVARQTMKGGEENGINGVTIFDIGFFFLFFFFDYLLC